MTESTAKEAPGGWICCCNGPILDPKRPAETMQCCRKYIWHGDLPPTDEDHRRLQEFLQKTPSYPRIATKDDAGYGLNDIWPGDIII